MSRLEELIKEYCPDGVTFKPLWSLTAWDKKFNGLDRTMQSKVISYKYYLSSEFDKVECEEGNIVYLSTGISGEKRYTTEELAGDYLSEGEVVCIPWGGTPNVKYFKGKFVTGDNRIATSLDTAILNNKFLYYWMDRNIELIGSFYRGSGIKHPSMKSVLELSIPVPPLPVQEEIVRILDSFTELTAELTAELEARREQYEAYRGKLLTFATDTPRKFLGETCEMKAGKAISSSLISPFKTNKQSIECYGGNGKRGYVAIANQHGAYPLIGRQGALCGNVNYASGDFYATEHAVVVKSKGEYTSRFLYHLLTQMKLNQYKSAGAQPGLAVSNLEKLSAPVPALEVQNKIARILDSFETLCNDSSFGLPAEIEARQKQYEYYRDKLLCFKNKNEN